MALRITDEARVMVQRAIDQSKLSDPVVNLVQSGAFVRTDDAIDRTLRRGDRSEIADLARRLPSSVRRGLTPAVFPRRQFKRWALIEVEGITFCFPVSLRLLTLTLCVTNGGLELLDSKGKPVFW
jgi:hypothetical protein